LQEKNQELFTKVKDLEMQLHSAQQELEKKTEDVNKLMTESAFFEQRLEE
jgi:regulator of replication initiation timing